MKDLPDLEDLLQETLKETEPSKKRQCPVCAVNFVAERSWQKFCSKPCKRVFHAAEAQAAKSRHSILLDEVQAENARLLQENKSLREQLLKTL